MPYTIGIDARKADDFGIGTYVRGLVGALARLDRENRYVLFVRQPSFGVLPANFREVLEPAPDYSLRELLALSWRLHRARLDAFHATHYVLPVRVPCPAVVTIHDVIHVLFPELLASRLGPLYARRMIGRSLRLARAVIAVSETTKADLVRLFHPRDPDRIHVIYNGVGEALRTPLAEPVVRQRLAALGVEPPFVLFVGNPKPHKNLENVLRAFARAVPELAQSARLVCAGGRQGPSPAHRALVAELGLGERVAWLGFVQRDDLRALYQGATLLVCPSLYEGFGLPAAEAMAAGLPVVTSNHSALAEIAADAAELVDPLDVGKIAAGIVRLFRDEPRRRELVERGRERSARWSWDWTAIRTRDLYLEAVGAPAISLPSSGERPRPPLPQPPTRGRR